VRVPDRHPADPAAVPGAQPDHQPEAALLALVSYAPQHVDELRRQSDLPIPVVSATLAMPELKGLIRQAGAMQYVRAREQRAEYAVDVGAPGAADSCRYQ
jgi:predicted Rossmann fold nucleotide-binding protein DprA/Smf involved in DNA uptake